MVLPYPAQVFELLVAALAPLYAFDVAVLTPQFSFPSTGFRVPSDFFNTDSDRKKIIERIVLGILEIGMSVEIITDLIE